MAQQKMWTLSYNTVTMSWINSKHYDPAWSLEGSYMCYIAIYRAEVPTSAKSWGRLEKNLLLSMA